MTLSSPDYELALDFRPKGVLAHTGSWSKNPIGYASRTLNSAEHSYMYMYHVYANKMQDLISTRKFVF